MSRVRAWREEAFATENFPWGSFSEQGRRLRVVGTHTRAYVNEFFSHPRQHPYMLLLISLALIGVAGDALTTYWLLQYPYFSEGNSVAAYLMHHLGLAGYTIVAVLGGLLAAFLLFVRGPNVIAWLIFGGGVTLCLFKLFVTGSNVYTFLSVVAHW